MEKTCFELEHFDPRFEACLMHIVHTLALVPSPWLKSSQIYIDVKQISKNCYGIAELSQQTCRIHPPAPPHLCSWDAKEHGIEAVGVLDEGRMADVHTWPGVNGDGNIWENVG